MLVSLVLQLSAESDTALCGDTGRAAQALFLQCIGQQDAALAEALHQSSGLRPYTVSALHAAGSRRGRLTEVRAGQRYWLRWTTLQEQLSQVVLELVGTLPGQRLELGAAVFAVQEVASAPTAHPWAARSSHNELTQAHFLSIANPLRRLELEFVSPTAFHHTVSAHPETGPDAEADRLLETGNRQPSAANRRLPTANRREQVTIPLPLPELVFGSLLQRWNAFAPLTLPEEVRRYAQACLAVSRYRLQTRMLQFGAAKSVGFVGQCQYTALVWDAYWLRALHLLAAYSFYSGVGIRTTVGMGQVYPQITQITQIRSGKDETD